MRARDPLPRTRSLLQRKNLSVCAHHRLGSDAPALLFNVTRRPAATARDGRKLRHEPSVRTSLVKAPNDAALHAAMAASWHL